MSQPEKVTIRKRIVTPEDVKKDTDGSVAVAENSGIVTGMNQDDPRFQSILEGRKCGICRHFDNEAAMVAMREQKFVERVMKDEKWREEWFNDYSQYGVCWVFSGDSGLRLNDPNAQATVAASDLDSSLTPGSAEGMAMQQCPYFVDVTKYGTTMTASRSGVRGPTTRREEARAYVLAHQERRRKGLKVL